jgi:hypothetical protein
VRHLPAHQPPARGVRLLLLLCRDWAGAIDVFLRLHAAGVLWAPTTSPVAALPHSGGDIHSLLRDVHLGVAVGHPIPDVPHAAVV